MLRGCSIFIAKLKIRRQKTEERRPSPCCLLPSFWFQMPTCHHGRYNNSQYDCIQKSLLLSLWPQYNKTADMSWRAVAKLPQYRGVKTPWWGIDANVVLYNCLTKATLLSRIEIKWSRIESDIKQRSNLLSHAGTRDEKWGKSPQRRKDDDPSFHLAHELQAFLGLSPLFSFIEVSIYLAQPFLLLPDPWKFICENWCM